MPTTSDHRPADDLGPAHDPGPDVARGAPRGGGGRRGGDGAARGPPTATGPRRDGVVDRPDDDRGGRVLPGRRRHGRGAAPVLRLADSRSSRSTRRTTRCRRGGCPSCGSSGRRPTSCSTSRPTRCSRASRRRRSGCPRRSARRCPRRSPTKPRLYAKDLPGELLAEVWRTFADGLAPLAEHGQLGAVFLQYPKWFFTSSENRDAIREAKAALEPSGSRSRSSSATGRGSTRRTPSGRCAS